MKNVTLFCQKYREFVIDIESNLGTKPERIFFLFLFILVHPIVSIFVLTAHVNIAGIRKENVSLVNFYIPILLLFYITLNILLIPIITLINSEVLFVIPFITMLSALIPILVFYDLYLVIFKDEQINASLIKIKSTLLTRKTVKGFSIGELDENI